MYRQRNNIDIIIPTLLLTIPCVQSFLRLISLMIYTLAEILIPKKTIMEKILYPTHPVRFIITRPSESGKSLFLTTIILNIINDYEKLYIYSPSLHQDLYQKLVEGFSNYIPIHLIPNILYEEDIDLVIGELNIN